MDRFFISILNNSITAAYLVIAILILRPFLKKVPHFLFCLLWVLVGIRLVFPVSLQSIISLIPSRETIPPEIVTTTTPMIHSGISLVNNAVNPVLSSTMAPTPEASANPMQIIVGIGWNVWIFGMLALTIYSICSIVILRHKLREAIHDTENIWLCDHIQTPFLLGIICPRIYLPSHLSENDIPYVLAHEHAHIRRKDHWWKPIGFALLTVYWFNPFMWIAYIFFCRDIEFSCDEKVIKELGTGCKKPYSDALINCSIPRRMITACPVAFGEDNVKKRIHSILNYKKPAFWIIILGIIACIATAAFFMTDPPESSAPAPQITPYHFTAKVMEVNEQSLLVQPLDEQGLRIADQIIITLPSANQSTYSVNDQIAIQYDGIVQELYPPIIPNVISIWKLNHPSSTMDIASSTATTYPCLAEATWDVDGDGVAETCLITYGPTSGLFTFVVTFYQNNIPEYRNIFISDAMDFSFKAADTSIHVLIGKTQTEQENTYQIAIENENIVLKSTEGDLSYLSDMPNLYGPTLSQVRRNYTHFLNLSTSKGLEVYVWKNNGWQCGLRAGAEKSATTQELNKLFQKSASIDEMAMILSTYNLPWDEITLLYSYDPAFSGPAPSRPSDQDHEFIEQTLQQYLPFYMHTDPIIPPFFDPMTDYEIVIYAYKMGEKLWQYNIYHKTSIVNSMQDAMFGFGGTNAERTKEIINQYNIPPDQIPVIVINSYISSYFYEIDESSILDARTQLGLS